MANDQSTRPGGKHRLVVVIESAEWEALNRFRRPFENASDVARAGIRKELERRRSANEGRINS